MVSTSTNNNIPNQNNLSNIISANIKDTNVIVKAVVNAISNDSALYSSKTINQISVYNEFINTLFSNNGIVTNIIKTSESFQKLNIKKLNKETIDAGFGIIKMIQKNTKQFVEDLKDFGDITMPNIDLKKLTQIIKDFTAFNALLGKTENDKTQAPSWIKFTVIKNGIKQIINLVKDIHYIITDGKNSINNTILSDTKILTNNISTVVKDIVEILNDLNSLKISNVLSLLLKNNVLKEITNVFDTINTIVKKLDTLKVSKTNITKLDNIVAIVNKFVDVSKKIIVLGSLSAIAAIAIGVTIITFIPALWLFMQSLLILSVSVVIAKKGIDTGMKAIASIVLSLLVIGTTIVAFALLTPVFIMSLRWGILQFIVATMVLSLLMFATFKFIGKLSLMTIPNILAFGLTIGVLVATLMASALVILIASKMTEQVNESIGKISLMIVGMLALTGAMILLGIGISALTPMIASSLIGFGQILGLIGLIFGIGVTINELAELKLKTSEAKSKTNDIVVTINSLREEIGKLEGNKKEWKSDKKVLKQVNKTVKTITKIANNLNELQNITIAKKTIIDNVTNIISFTQKLQDLMNKLVFGGTVDDVSSSNWLKRNIASIFHKNAANQTKKNLKSDKKVLNRVDRVINKLVDIGEGLATIGEFKLTGDFKKLITDNVESIFTFITRLDTKINSFLKTDNVSSDDILDAKKMRNKEWRKNKKVLNKVEATIATIGGVADTLNILKDFKFVEGNASKGILGTKDIIAKNIDIIFGAIDEVSKLVNGKVNDIVVDANKISKLTPLVDFTNSLNNAFNNLATGNTTAIETNVSNYIKLIDRFSTIAPESFNSVTKYINDINNDFNDIAKINNKQFEKNINNYSNFVEKVNSIDVEKTQKTAQMFEQMANFSNSIKGDFDNLAESLSSKLLPVLTELKDVMSSVPEKLDIGFQNTSASIAATTAPTTKENITAQSLRENPNLTAEQIDQIVARRMREKAKADANSVNAKIDELLTLLKGFGGANVVVKTI